MTWCLSIVCGQTHEQYHPNAPHHQCNHDTDGNNDLWVSIQVRDNGCRALCFGKRGSPVPKSYHVELLRSLNHTRSVDERGDWRTTYARISTTEA